MSDLDQRVRLAAALWGLVIGEALAGGTRSAVFAARDDLGRDLVVKLPAARADPRDVTAAEAAALATWADTGAAVALVAATDDALLLVRVRPGTFRPWWPAEPLDDTVAMAAELLGRLWAAPAGSYRYPTLAEVYAQDERVARDDAAFEQSARGEPDRGAPGVQRLPAAAAVAEQLIATTAAPTLLHGDFITKNLLSDATSAVGWVAIDPLPMTGDPAAEVAAFAAYHPADLILPLAEGLARQVRLDQRRSLRWAAIWAVHQAAQAWRDDQEQLERLIASATINELLKP